jgi:hypothetical protein
MRGKHNGGTIPLPATQPRTPALRVLRTSRSGTQGKRLGGSLRRGCLDFLIPNNESHLKMAVKE